MDSLLSIENIWTFLMVRGRPDEATIGATHFQEWAFEIEIWR